MQEYKGERKMDSPSIAHSFKSVFNSVGRQHEKPLKQAFYNTGALAFLLVSGVVAINAYYVLEAFFKPLIWASLCGTFLFPFKKASTKIVRDWLTDLEENDKTFFIALPLLPLEVCNKCFYLLENVAKLNWKLLLTVFVLVPLVYGLVIFHPFYQIFYGIEIVVTTLMKIIALFNNPVAVWTLFIAYILLISLWKIQDEEPEVVLYVKKTFSILIWFIVVFYMISLTGSWKVPIVIFVVTLMTIGYIEQKKVQRIKNEGKFIENALKSQFSVKFVVDNTLTVLGINKMTRNSISSTTLSTCDSSGSLDDSATSINTTTEEVASNVISSIMTEDETSNISEIPTPPPKLERLNSTYKKKKKHSNRSDPYFIALLWLFALSFFWGHLSIFSVFLFLLLLKYVLKSIVTTEIVQSRLNIISKFTQDFYMQRKEVMCPWVVRNVLSVLHSGDQKLIYYMNGGIDKLMSMMIILCLVTLASLGTAFFALQVQQESSYLVAVATNVVNQTIVSNKEYVKWLNLNDSDIRKSFDTTIHSGYIVARGKVAEYISSVLTSKESNTTYMEHQLTQLMDQLYDAWSGQKDNIKRTPAHSLKNQSITSFTHNNVLMAAWYRFKKLANSSDFAKLFEIFKENLHTMYSVLDSLWLILKGNMNLMISIITTIFSMLFFSGTYLLNALISSIIFITTLFYLLNSSSEEYKLMELMSGLSMGTRFGESIANAVQDVFGASLKMATFYFLFTWLTHDAFGANLVFIPAAFAAMLGVVPFIGTYWAAVPAALEIWLIQDKGMLSVFLIALHFLPTYVVDTAIYSEIGEGGHPYLTGLAVAGGVYCFGLEGAFFGPFVLCCLIAAFEIYNSVMNSSDVQERSN